jgi:predicted transcriptional regulator
MSIVHDELAGFQRFAEERLRSGEAQSLDELFDLWRLEHPTPDEQDDVHAAIREGLEDLKAGRYRPADEVTAELRAKYGV